MESLRDCYQSATIKDVCPTCSSWADKQLDEIRDANAPELRRRLAERAIKKHKPTLWQRFTGSALQNKISQTDAESGTGKTQ